MPLGASPGWWRIVSDALISENITAQVDQDVRMIISEPYPDGNITRIDAFSRKIVYGRMWVDFDLDQLEPNTVVIDGEIWDFNVEDIIWAAEVDITKPSIIYIIQKRVFWEDRGRIWVIAPGWEIQVFENIRSPESRKPSKIQLIAEQQVIALEILRDLREDKVDTI
jgi:hypothetical protein